jgi:hypothetical protein
MRKEKVSIPNIGALTPWITQQDLVDVYRAAQAVGADLDNHMNSDVFQFIVSNGYYAQLALENKAHFCPYNWVKFEQAQAAALAMVDAQVPINVASPNAVAPIPADAVAQVAYGLHFLSDAFSGGHMRVPRAELGRDGSFLSGVMHDFDGKMGLAVENGLGDRWCAFGDGNLDNQSSAQRDRLAAMTALSDGRREANREHAQAAMGAAMKQLHYQAQKHYGDAQNAAWFQPILDGVRGTSSGLQFDNLVEGNPGDGSSRDAWIAMDAATKLTYMRKHQPRPLAVSMAWRSGAGNFPPLVELDANQKPVIATQGAYRWVKHKMKLNKDRVLRYEGDSGLELDFTTYFQLATNFPSGALSWSGTREKWLQVLLQTMPEQ